VCGSAPVASLGWPKELSDPGVALLPVAGLGPCGELDDEARAGRAGAGGQLIELRDRVGWE
jgi:hypothetical protein